MAKKKYDPAADKNKLIKDAQSIGMALKMEYEDIAGIQQDILNGLIKTNEAMLKNLKTAKEDTENKKSKLKLQQAENDLVKDLSSIQKTIQGNYKKLFNTTKDTFEVQRDIVQSKEDEIEQARRSGKITSDLAKELQAQLKTRKADLAAQEEIQKRYQSQYDTVTAMGGFLKKNFGQVGELIDGSMNAGMEAFVESYANTNDSAQAQQAAMKAFGGQLSSNVLKMLSLVGVATLLYTTLSDALKAVKDFASATGASIGQSQELVTSAKQYAATSGLTLATAEKTLDVQKQMIAEFGNINSISTETAAKVAQIGESFGYGAQLAGQVQSAMMSIGTSAEDAMKIQGFTSALAESAGVAPGAVMKDIAQNAKVTAKYFAGNPKALAKAAVEAARMGMSLQDMASVADKLLDIESSLTAQFEASAMLGRTINMDKARQLALDGDIEGATKATLEQVGSIADFEKMSMLQRKKIAQAAGMEVSQIEKALQLQEKTKGMSADQLATVNKYGDALGDVSKMNEKDILQRTTSLQAADELNATITQLKDTFTTILLPAAKVFGTVLMAALWPVTTMLQGFREIYDFFVNGGEQLSFWGTTLATIATTMGIIKAYQLATTAAAGLKAMFDKQSEKSLFSQGLIMLKNLGTAIATAVANITGMSAMTLGVAAGIGLAAGGAAYAFLNSKKTGDLGIDANGGPVVMSPRENTIFQGTKNDDVAMYPGATTGGGSTDMTETNSLLRQLLSAMKTPVPVVIGDKAVNEIGKQYATNSSYKPAGSR